MKNCSRTCEQQAHMAANTSQDVGRSGLVRTAKRTRRFEVPRAPGRLETALPITCRCARVCPLRSLARTVSSRLLLFPIKTVPGRFPSYHSCTGACHQGELISCLNRVAFSENLSHPPCVESLWLPSQTRPPAISFPREPTTGVLLAPCHDEFRGPRSDYVRQLLEGFLATVLVILNHGQVTRTTPELTLPSPNFHITPTGGRLSLDIFSVHRSSTRRVLSGTRLELMIHPDSPLPRPLGYRGHQSTEVINV
ncbi:hypothetical protein TNCV_4106061 [Trichonephila clavipes]|nr:hypothetical protein TNCV_4106061 [Trichonephila clavipes]